MVESNDITSKQEPGLAHGWCVVRAEAIPVRRLFAPPQWRFVAAKRDCFTAIVATSAVFSAPAADTFDRYTLAWHLIPHQTAEAERHLDELTVTLAAAGWARTWVATPFWYCRHFRRATPPSEASRED